MRNWINKFKDKDWLRRVALGIFCWLAIALFIHFREVKVESFELGSVAQHYVVSPIDFYFADDEATKIMREDALKEIGEVYRLDAIELKQKRFDFDNYLVNEKGWQESINASYEDLYNLSGDLVEFLSKVRFVDINTFHKLKEIGFPDINLVVFIPTPNKKDSKIFLGNEYWTPLKNLFIKKHHTFKEENELTAFNFVVKFFQEQKLKLSRDDEIQKKLTKFIEEKIPQKYTSISAGTKIISQGEKITPRHLAILESEKKAEQAKQTIWDPETILGSLLLSVIFVFISGFYFKLEQPYMLTSWQKEGIVVAVVIVTLIFAKLCSLAIMSSYGVYLRYPILIPFSSILLTILLGGRIALFCSAFLALIVSMTLDIDVLHFLVLNLVTSLIAIVSTKALRRRTEIFVVSAKCFLGALLVILAFNTISKTVWEYSTMIEIGLVGILLFFSSVLVLGVLPLLESAFNVMTDITLMEYMDPRFPLLSRLMVEMPGTYQHCLFLGHLAEAAAAAIDANALFCKVAILYHDIGKLIHPQYFTENQVEDSHKGLLPVESAKLIIDHVKEGERIAKENHLPSSFIDIIKEHHGTTLVYYFYRKEVERCEGDLSKVDENSFRYAGPKPHSKESAIVMICDAVEAASRSLEEINESKVTELVEKVISDKSEDGQFDESPLTFEEIEKIKKALIATLLASHHVRIKYPEKNFNI